MKRYLLHFLRKKIKASKNVKDAFIVMYLIISV